MNVTEARDHEDYSAFSITLPLEMVKAVERKIKSGAYASVNEVMRDGVRVLLDRDAAWNAGSMKK